MQHTGLSIEKWESYPYLARLANIGSEVCRAMSWKEKGNSEYGELAFLRSLELIDLTYKTKKTYSQQKELSRMREMWIDFYKYDNEYKTDRRFWENYFNYITVRSKS